MSVSAAKRLFPDPQFGALPVAGSDALYPVHRIFCVGRNYAEHAKEMGVEVDREEPFYFLKNPLSLVPGGATIPYPPGTANYHYEMELVVAVGRPVFRAAPGAAADAAFGYACGLDMTRRDLQLKARAASRPWDMGKDFEQSAVVSALTRAAGAGALGPKRIWLEVDGTVRQEARLADLIWNVDEIVCHLSQFYHLVPGDLIFTGTPAGVGAVSPGSRLRGGIDGLGEVTLAIGAAE